MPFSNYTTALGFLNEKYHDYDQYWPADVHIVGKEIVRFHSIIWPAMLMSMEMPLPKKVYGHGWLNFNGEKMSKSRGNVVDPYLLAGRYGVDALRFFLLRDFPFGSDGNFTNELLISRINSDLANVLGNLVSRTSAMVQKYFSGVLPAEQEEGPEDEELLSVAKALPAAYRAEMDKFALQNGLQEVFKLLNRANKYIDETAPWALAKAEEHKKRLARVLYNLEESLRIAAGFLSPFIPETAEKILQRLGNPQADWESLQRWGVLPATAGMEQGEALFQRIDAEKELAELEALEKKPEPTVPRPKDEEEKIGIEDFEKSGIALCKDRERRARSPLQKALKADGRPGLRKADGGLRHCALLQTGGLRGQKDRLGLQPEAGNPLRRGKQRYDSGLRRGPCNGAVFGRNHTLRQPNPLKFRRSAQNPLSRNPCALPPLF